MRVKVLYFAAIRDLLHVAEEEHALPAGVDSVGDFAAWIARAHPELAGRMSAVRIARNEEFATADQQLADGDTLALIPPVAGG